MVASDSAACSRVVSPPSPISRRRSAAGGAGTVRLRSGAGGSSDSPVPARRPPSVPTATMNRGGSSPSAATNYLICTNCRKVLRKVRARPGVRLGGALSAGLGSGCSAGRARSCREAPRDPGHLPPPRPGKGAWVEGAGWRLLLCSSAGTDSGPEGLAIFFFLTFYFFGKGVLCAVFGLILPNQPAPRAQGRERGGPVRFSCRCC